MSSELVLTKGSKTKTYKMIQPHSEVKFDKTPVKRMLSSFQQGQGSVVPASSLVATHPTNVSAPTQAVPPPSIATSKQKKIKETESGLLFRQKLFLTQKEMMVETGKMIRAQGSASSTKPVSVEEAVHSRAPPVVDNTPKLPNEIPPNALYSPAFLAAASQPSVQNEIVKQQKRIERDRTLTAGNATSPAITDRSFTQKLGLPQSTTNYLSTSTSSKTKQGAFASLPPPSKFTGEDSDDTPGSSATGSANPNSTAARLKEMLIPSRSRPRPIASFPEPMYVDYAEFFATTGTPLQAPKRMDPHVVREKKRKGSSSDSQSRNEKSVEKMTERDFGGSGKQKGREVDRLATMLTGDLAGSTQKKDLSGTSTSTSTSGAMSQQLSSASHAATTQGTIKDYSFLAETTRRLGESRSEAASLFGLGILYDNEAMYKKSIPCYERLCLLSRRLCDQQGEALALNALGNAYFFLSTPESLQKALDCYERHHSLVSTPPLPNGADDGQYAAPLSSFSFKSRDRFIALSNLGLIHATLGEYETASLYLQKALGELVETEDIADSAEGEEEGGDESGEGVLGSSKKRAGEAMQTKRRTISNEDELRTLGMLTQIEDYLMRHREEEGGADGEDPGMPAAILRPCLDRQLQLSLQLKGTQLATNTAATLQMLAQLDSVEGKTKDAEVKYNLARKVALDSGDIRGANAAKVGMGIVAGKEKMEELMRSLKGQMQPKTEGFESSGDNEALNSSRRRMEMMDEPIDEIEEDHMQKIGDEDVQDDIQETENTDLKGESYEEMS
ncbi:uncharacterized protein MONOS_210 [Monocercomonoides exilis]|uniref:uncharacterized protein n=1 Tax=Monocercomonoides exilis TaxID=2049356 RepID=UPI00355A904E|nr:hypothetical protein MONOS_210 [Monocercomonoides exilis]|eukprot:MONOS_210.1-p1 / transcript=MONOS_210.1 / gene=MONOS_210 / organism=Monocercomonoides_exilis_PA203 / gene_product=unspecified product / transcript_product=unspecified product / location=Mono_scaffold00003:264331-267146(-) / protein_length=786 / sequence_SO=supercontig / SO=protein_coding / is_pseudo=false